MQAKGPIRTCRKSWECRYGADCNENNTCVCTHHCKGQKQFPVCASNRHTYKNLCKLKKASCMQQRPITIKCHGDCDTCLKIFKAKTRLFQIAKESNTVTLYCWFPPPKYSLPFYQKRVKWFVERGKGNIIPVLKKEWYIYSEYESYRGRVELSEAEGNASLTIQNVQLSDAGKYGCHVKVGVDRDTAYVSLTVISKGKCMSSAVDNFLFDKIQLNVFKTTKNSI
ncbi:uncharacterized protein LOC143445055 isoform X2 [Clavelina lepadiformis]|uniref:uncharacterized protein LOC143445055 isoform X2 n=1 Tax=Clavelina lepadiformis TaxID=159417 RepID=UPI004042DF58